MMDTVWSLVWRILLVGGMVYGLSAFILAFLSPGLALLDLIIGTNKTNTGWIDKHWNKILIVYFGVATAVFIGAVSWASYSNGLVAGQEISDAEKESVYSDGYNEGYDMGYEQGSEIGQNVGASVGYEDGYDEGYTAGYNDAIDYANEWINNHYGDGKDEYYSQTVYVTDTGDCYHEEWCSYLESKHPVTLQQAINQGYRPCSYCNPPD